MASIPIHNETTYTLTDDITQQIIRDAQEHFGEEVRAIRVQSGLAQFLAVCSGPKTQS